jgi:hypothetical protein
MSPTLQKALIFTVVAAAFMLMLRSAPTPEIAAIRLFHTFVPLTAVLGMVGVFKAMRNGWDFGAHRHDTEGLAVFSCLALAWAHEAGWALLRRSAQARGHDAEWMLYSDYRLFCGSLIVLSVFLVLRWSTRHDFAAAWGWPDWVRSDIAGELPWAGFVVLWMLFVTYQGDSITRGLTWFYVAMF